MESWFSDWLHTQGVAMILLVICIAPHDFVRAEQRTGAAVILWRR